MLDEAVAPAGGDIGDAERAGTGSARRRAPKRDAPQEIEIFRRRPSRTFQPTSTVELASAVASDGLIAAPLSRAPPPRRAEKSSSRIGS